MKIRYDTRIQKIFMLILSVIFLTFATNLKAEFKTETIIQGSGSKAELGMRVQVHYTGKLVDGTVFDSSVPRGAPFVFTLGQRQVIQGWEKGILGMLVGETRILTIPPALAYGTSGAGDTIPPNATLIFDVQLIATSWPPSLNEFKTDQLLDAQKMEVLLLIYEVQMNGLKLESLKVPKQSLHSHQMEICIVISEKSFFR